jgi:hypothetical protein
MISVRMESAASIHYAYNYFYNSTYMPAEETTAASPEAATTVTETSAETSTYSGYPSFTITKVKKNTSVTLMAENLPEGEIFDVMLSNYQDGSFEPVKAGTLDSSKGGSMETSFTIPEDMKDVNQISVRLTGTKTGYFAYNFFFNSDYPVEQVLPQAETTPASAPTMSPTPAPTAVQSTATSTP